MKPDTKLLILFEGINGNASNVDPHSSDAIVSEIQKHVDIVEYVRDYTHLRNIPEFAARITTGLIQKHKASRVSIVGYSLGGMVAQEAAIHLATTQPHIHIDCVILIATTAPISSSSPVPSTHIHARILQRALEVLYESPPDIQLVLQREIRQLSSNPQLDKLFQQYSHLLESNTTVRLLQVAAEWILHQTCAPPPPPILHRTNQTRVIIIAPELDELFPSELHTDRIKRHLEQRSGFTEFEYVKLERSNHTGVATHRDAQMGGEFIGKCGNLGLVGKLRFLLNYKPTEVGIAIAALAVVLTILLVALVRNARS